MAKVENMNEAQKEALEAIENQLYGINANDISLHWIGLKETPTMDDIMNLNKMLGFIITELRALRETGELDVNALHKQYMEDP